LFSFKSVSRTRFQTDRVKGHRIAEPETLFPVGVAPGERKTPENPACGRQRCATVIPDVDKPAILDSNQ